MHHLGEYFKKTGPIGLMVLGAGFLSKSWLSLIPLLLGLAWLVLSFEFVQRAIPVTIAWKRDL